MSRRRRHRARTPPRLDEHEAGLQCFPAHMDGVARQQTAAGAHQRDDMQPTGNRVGDRGDRDIGRVADQDLYRVVIRRGECQPVG